MQLDFLTQMGSLHEETCPQMYCEGLSLVCAELLFTEPSGRIRKLMACGCSVCMKAICDIVMSELQADKAF